MHYHLWHKPDGTYTAAPSTSPEHGPVDEGVTFAHAVVREILLDAIEASKVLGVDRKERRQWKNILAKLVPYRIGRYGQLLDCRTAEVSVYLERRMGIPEVVQCTVFQ